MIKKRNNYFTKYCVVCGDEISKYEGCVNKNCFYCPIGKCNACCMANKETEEGELPLFDNEFYDEEDL